MGSKAQCLTSQTVRSTARYPECIGSRIEIDAPQTVVRGLTDCEYDMQTGPLDGALDSVLVSHLLHREIRERFNGLKRYAGTVVARASGVATHAAIE